MTIAQKWVALVPVRKALYSRPDGKAFQWLVEKKLTSLIVLVAFRPNGFP